MKNLNPSQTLAARRTAVSVLRTGAISALADVHYMVVVSPNATPLLSFRNTLMISTRP